MLRYWQKYSSACLLTFDIGMPIIGGMNWQKLISEIEDSGRTQVEIAEKVGCSQPTISDIKNGKIKNPGFPVGKAIVDLHGSLKTPSKKVAA